MAIPLLTATLIGAQSLGTADADVGLILTTESSLVVVPLHVFEKKTSIGGLGKEAFELLENGVMRKIAFVEGPALNTAEERAVPIEIVFLIDVGDSTMRPGLLDVASIHNSLRAGPGKNVTVSVYGFARKLTRFAGPTNKPS